MRRPVGVTLLTAFFGFGALMAFLAFLGLLLSDGFLEPIWRLNPDAHRALTELGAWGMLLMVAVAIACALAAIGLWIQAQWGRRLAVGILAINLLGDVNERSHAGRPADPDWDSHRRGHDLLSSQDSNPGAV